MRALGQFPTRMMLTGLGIWLVGTVGACAVVLAAMTSIRGPPPHLQGADLFRLADGPWGADHPCA